MRTVFKTIVTAAVALAAGHAAAWDFDDNPPGRAGGPGTNWENPPGVVGGPGTSPDRRPWAPWYRYPPKPYGYYRPGRPGYWYDRDDNPPGFRGGPGTNWENPPGPLGGPGASPDRRRHWTY